MNDNYFDDFVAGRVYEHSARRTITEADNIILSCLTLNLQPLHIDAEFARNSMWKQVLVDSMVTIGVIVGIQSVDIIRGTAEGTQWIKEVRFPHPVFHGDTLRGQTTVLDKHESDRFPDCGVLDLKLEGFNQRDELVMTGTWARVVHKRSAAGSLPAGYRRS